ncbi:ABC transporter ATP-binding protein [Pseudoalteromonas piscicida]|uniref:ABC transporter ATP-binding protein n=1 Tax=Pseudoalteromonas piscicida TaxID=43662 RepID=UPI0005F9BE68|nr:ABC transporter ATP-binding protein [Pseudoalteromonas piscicida]KJY97448.1 multidrug ABC transporter ATPase [Pseudoalteromonas piscicida]QZO15330.1 ABC transporter ATP-binding protein [Pseudoalteromonas piscicida]
MSNAIELSNISFAYNNTKPILADLNLTLEQGKVYSILGPNGAGKTTLINIMLGRLRPTSGRVSVLGHQPESDFCRQRVGAMMQLGGLPLQTKVKEFLALFASYHQAPIPLERLISLCQLAPFLEQTFDTLSGGQKQRLFMAIALAGNPDIVFLDEPSVGMDVESRQQLWQAVRTLKQQNKTVLLTTHYLHEAEALADELLVLKEGKCTKLNDIPELANTYRRSQIKFTSDLSAAALVNALPMVDLNVKGDQFTILTDEPNHILQQLLEKFSIRNLYVAPMSLEEAYLSLMNARSA